MEKYEHFNTAFIVKDANLLDDFLEISFKRLKYEACKAFKEAGTYSIAMTIEAKKNKKDVAQVLHLEEVF